MEQKIAVHYRGKDSRFHAMFVNELIRNNPRPKNMTGRQWKKLQQKNRSIMEGPRGKRKAKQLFDSITKDQNANKPDHSTDVNGRLRSAKRRVEKRSKIQAT